MNGLIERCNAGIERQDYHAALICAVFANVNRDPKRRSRPFTPADFMPTSAGEPSETVQPQEELDYLLAFGQNIGAQVIVHG